MSITQPDDRVTSYAPVVPTTTFAADFPVFDNSDLSVIHNGVERMDFTVQASYVASISNDARVVFATGITGSVLVVGTRDPRRSNRFGAGPINANMLNAAFDTIQGEMQEARRDVERSLKVPLGTSPLGIPEPSDNTVLGWDGENLVNKDPGDFINDAGFATAEQGGKADTAVQPNNIPALVAAAEVKSNIWIPGREFSLPAGYGAGTAAAFNAAMAAVASRGGGEVIVPADAPIILDGTIDNKYAGVLLRSNHVQRNFSNGGADPYGQGARFVASAAMAGGEMFRHRTPKASEMAGVKQRINSGGGFEGISWLGNGFAALGVHVTSIWHGVYHGSVSGVSSVQGGTFAVLFDCGVQGVDYQDTGSTQHCDVDLAIRLIDNSHEYDVTGVAFIPSSNANFSMNKSVRFDVVHKNGSALFAQGMDNNDIVIRAFRISGGTGYGVLINGVGLVAGDPVGCDANHFDVSSNGPILATGTETGGITAGVRNVIFRDEANGTQAPLAGTGSYWRDITSHGTESGGAFNKHAVGDSYTSAKQALDFLRANSLYSQALVNGSNAHQALISAAGTWRVFVDASSGDYVIGRVAGSGVLDIGGNVKFGGKQVSAGDLNSGGTGFRCLRVPN